jgi:hypothetical protein
VHEIKTVFGLVLNVLHVAAWSVGTVWLGCKTGVRSTVLLFRWRRITAEVLLCPRGHEVPVYGLWDCACGSRIEGWAFAACRICHESAGYVPCALCGLPVRNPFLT